MRPLSRATRLLARPALAALALVALTAESPQGVQTQLDCEEAVAHCASCTDLDPKLVYCEYQQGCDIPAHVPDLTVEQSEAILQLDCADLAASGMCAAIHGTGFHASLQ